MKSRELSNEYLSTLCNELSMLIQAGIAPYDCVLMLYDDERDDNAKLVIKSLIDNLEKGASLSAALRESGFFPQYLITMTLAGEKTGRLTEALSALSEHYNRQERLIASILEAVFYPLLLFIIMAAVVFIIIIRVLPIFNRVFNMLGAQMPPAALSIMRFGGWLTRFFTVFAAILGAVLVLAVIAWMLPGVRSYIKKAFGNSFGDRGIFRKITVSHIISIMALATASGMDPESAVALAVSAGGGSEAIEKKYALFLEAHHSGETFPEALLKAGFLTPRNSRMLTVGARSGMSDSAMAEIASRCERDTQAEIDRLVKLIEPALVVASSVIVGAILLMVMIPLISIMSSIG